jgi:hypothetical protein
MENILAGARPMKMHVQQSLPEEANHESVDRENAHVLLVNEAQALEELTKGPPDGKAILMRRNRQNERSAESTLRLIGLCGPEIIQVQDPTTENYNTIGFPRSEIAELLTRTTMDGTQVGYKPDQIPPYNLIDLPSDQSMIPQCLISEKIMIPHLLRVGSKSEASQAARSLFWDLLCANMASTLPHQDHDGHGTYVCMKFGYKVWISWRDISSDAREEFVREGTDFNGLDSRYVILGPGDEYVQTTAISQDVHAVQSVAYCNVDECNGNCEKWGYQKCARLIGARGMHYHHMDFMHSSMEAALDDLLHEHITNEDPHKDFVERMEDIEKILDGDNNFQTDRVRFKKALKVRKHYL